MSLGESDAKFPNQANVGIPPSPTRENPGQVYPKSDPRDAPPESIPGTGGEHEPASVMGNPFAFKNALDKLNLALDEVVSALQGEESRMGSSSNENVLLRKFQTWRDEVVSLKSRDGERTSTKGTGVTQEGPMFTD